MKHPRALLVLALSAALCATAQAAEAIKIGVAGPMTGANAAHGERMWRGASLAVEHLNAAGGINGRKIELVKGDDACEPKQAVAVANRLVDKEQVNAVVGHFCSSSTLPASDIYAEGDVVMVTVSSAPQITERGLPIVIRIGGRDDQQGDIAADFIIDRLKAGKVAVIHDKDTYGQGVADTTRARLNQRGVKEVLYEGLTRGEKDFNALVTKIKATGAEAVYFGGCYPEAGALVRQMREQGVGAKLVGGDCVLNPDLVAAAGGAQYTDGVYVTFGRDARNIPESKQVVESFRKSGFEPDGYTLYAYAAVQSIAAAMQASGSTEGKAVADWLKANTVPTAMGPKGWDSKGDLKVSDFVMYVYGADGVARELNN